VKVTQKLKINLLNLELLLDSVKVQQLLVILFLFNKQWQLVSQSMFCDI